MYQASQQNEVSRRIGNWIHPRLNKLELGISSGLIIVIIFQVLTELNLSILIAIPLLGLAIIYFFYAFADLIMEIPSGIYIFTTKLAAFGSAIIIMGILFRLMHWPGYDVSLPAGLLMLTITLLLIVVRLLKGKERANYSRRHVFRIVILILVGLVLFLVDEEVLIELGISSV